MITSLGLPAESNNSNGEGEEQRELARQMKSMKKSIEDMHMTLNEKEAEIIRLTLCLGDEKKRNNERSALSNIENTPQSKYHNHHGSGAGSGSPYFFRQNSSSSYIKNYTPSK